MINLEETKIAVSSDILQKGINHFVDAVNEQFNIDLNNNILSEAKMDEIDDYSYEVFDQYIIEDKELFPLAAELYANDYNVLEKAVELENTNPLIVNYVLKDYVIANILDHQAMLKKTFEKDNQQFER